MELSKMPSKCLFVSPKKNNYSIIPRQSRSKDKNIQDIQKISAALVSSIY